MQTILFVHGTGVREPAYTKSFGRVQEELLRRLGASNLRLEPCYWGGTCGSTLLLKGLAIPEFDKSRAIEEELDPAEYALALWAVLYDDPLAELSVLALRAGDQEEPPPGQETIGENLDQHFKTLSADGAGLPAPAQEEFSTLLTQTGVIEYFDIARGQIAETAAYKKAVAIAVEPLTDYRLALARALVARCVQLHRDEHEVPDGTLPMSGAARDRLVELIVAALGGREAGVIDWVKSKAGGLIKGVGTRWVRKRRGRLSDQAAPFGADVIVYQTRPDPMRRFIRDAIVKASDAAKARSESGEVSVIAHSLGGIATVDLLIEGPLMPVRHLITVGSQAPLLYELDALSSRPILRNPDGSVKPVPHHLPDHFPRSWLNIYDPRDFLSYRASAIFGSDRVTDKEVDNDQPFPESHSAYWDNRRVWDAITALLNKGS